MFDRADKHVVKKLINKIQNYDIKKNIDIIKDFFEFLKKYYTNYFENEKIIPNQNYQLCYADSLYKDGIKDEDMKKILGTLFNIDLKEILILDDFSNIIRASTYDYMDLSNSVNNKIEKLISKPEKYRFDFYSIFFQYSYENEKLKQMIEFINYFLVDQIKYTNKELPENQCWSSTLIENVINIILDDIKQKISSLSNIDQIRDGDRQDIYKNLTILYRYSTNLFGKIFPNLFGQLKYKEEIKIIYDTKIEKSLLVKLFDYLIIFRESDEIKQSVLDYLIEIPDDLRNEFQTIDIKYMHNDIMSHISNHKKNVELMTSFLKFLGSSEYLKSAFSDLFKEKKGTNYTRNSCKSEFI